MAAAGTVGARVAINPDKEVLGTFSSGASAMIESGSPDPDPERVRG